MYLRIVKTIYIFNPEHDLALSNGDRHYIPPKNIREMAHDLAELMSATVALHESTDERHSPLCPWGWDSAVVERFKKIDYPTLQLPSDESLNALRQYSERSTAHRFLSTFIQSHSNSTYTGESLIIHTIEGIASYAERHRHILLKAPLSSSGKGLRHVNEEGFNLPSSQRGSTAESTATHQRNLLQNPLEQTKENYSSKIGKRADCNEIEQSGGGMSALKKVENWANALIQRHGYLTAEPYYDKVQDFAMEFMVDAIGCRFIGYSLFVTDGHGRYTGSRLMSDAHIEDLLATYVAREALHEIYRWTTAHYTDIIPKEWDVAQFPLYFGIDMMIVRKNQRPTSNIELDQEQRLITDSAERSNLNNVNRQQTEESSDFPIANSQFKIHPCVEINLRMNMGIIAHELYRHHMVPTAEGMFRIARFPSNEALRRFHSEQSELHPAVFQDDRLAEGYLELTPITHEALHLAYIHAQKQD